MMDLLLNLTPMGVPTVTIGKQAIATLLPTNILPNNTLGFAYTKGSNTGYVVGGRVGATSTSKIIKIDLLTNALSIDTDIPTDINTDSVSSAMVGDTIYSYTGWSFFKYDTVSRTIFKYPDFTDSRFATTPGQMEGSYNGKIYKCNRVSTNNFNVLEYDTVTNTHSVFKSVVGVTNIGLFVTSIVVGNMLYISDPQMARDICQVNLDTKEVLLLPMALPVNPNGTATSLAVGSDRLFVFSDTTTVSSVSLTSPYTGRSEPPLINKRPMTAVFTNSGYMKSYIGTTQNVNDYLSYAIGE